MQWLEANEKGRPLDVGCGNGAYIDQMRQLGWDVVGIEPDGEAASTAMKSGLNVFRGSLEDAKFPAEHFDIVTMNHVIEHVANPAILLKECRRVLKPVGRLVVATTKYQEHGTLCIWGALAGPGGSTPSNALLTGGIAGMRRESGSGCPDSSNDGQKRPRDVGCQQLYQKGRRDARRHSDGDGPLDEDAGAGISGKGAMDFSGRERLARRFVMVARRR